jgi:CRISPR-associated endoribonuclease Cas6
LRFKITLNLESSSNAIPINYQYPLSSALYRIISKGDAKYAEFLHQTGYGKGFKFFTFSQINCPFKISGDRLLLQSSQLNFEVAFHLPQAMESFIKGLFQSEKIDIADKKSRASFTVKSVESLPNPLQSYKDNEIVSLHLKPLSPIVAGLPNDKGHYDFLDPKDPRFTESLIYNWQSKIEVCYDEAMPNDRRNTGAFPDNREVLAVRDVETLHCNVSTGALLLMDTLLQKQSPKSRLITIKADTEQETKIRGWLNFELKVTGEKRFVELLLNAGCGVYNSMGCGCVEVVK